MTPDTLSTISSINRSIVTCSRCASARRRARASGARREPHRPHVHGRLERHLAVRGVVSAWLRESTAIAVARRRPDAQRLLYRRGRAVRTARQQAEPPRARALPSLSRRRAALAATRARGGDAGPHCARELAQGGGVVAAARAARSAAVRTRRREPPARWERRDRVLPPEPAEHQHREAQPDDVVRGVSSG